MSWIRRFRSRAHVPAGIRRSSGARWFRLSRGAADPLRRLRLSSMTVAVWDEEPMRVTAIFFPLKSAGVLISGVEKKGLG